MNEPSIFDTPTRTMPLDVLHRIDEPGFKARTATHAEIHNVYGMENSRATYEGLRTLDPDERPFVLTRASYAGGQRYAATWTGDNSSTWNHLRMTTPMLAEPGAERVLLSAARMWAALPARPRRSCSPSGLRLQPFSPSTATIRKRVSGDQEPWVGGARSSTSVAASSKRATG